MSRQKKPEVPIDPEVDFQNRLRADNILEAINANLPVGAKQLVKIPREYVFKKSTDTIAVTVALHSAFELKGGVPGLIHWANDNPTQFYQLWAKLLPNENTLNANGVQINFTSAVPMNDLDRVTINDDGKVIDIDDVPD